MLQQACGCGGVHIASPFSPVRKSMHAYAKTRLKTLILRNDMMFIRFGE
ncbi:hypothetical protein CSC17_3378 [Klebsiella oxytoca]|nr:hypothetical protein CSC17_3378 [Klebsiella oxytoca]